MSTLTRKQATALLLFGMAMGLVGIVDGSVWMRTAAGVELVCITGLALTWIWWPAKWRDQ